MDEMRKRFENWMSDGGRWPKAIQRDGAGGYILMQTSSAWNAWQFAWDAARAYEKSHPDSETHGP